MKNILKNDKIQVALWVGVSFLIGKVLEAFLQIPELANWYGVINIILYALKGIKK